MKTRIIAIAGIIAIILLIGFRLAANKTKLDEKNKIPEKTDLNIPVGVATVTEGVSDAPLVRTGNLIPYQTAQVMATAAGKVTDVRFDLGTYVKKGTPVVQIDSRLKELSLEATELNIDKLKKDTDRYTRLLAGNAATEVQVNDTKYSYESALNQAEQIRQQIKDATVTAPISGRIVKKSIEAGEYVNTGAALATVLDMSRLKVQVMIPENDVYQLKEGQHVQVTTDIYPGKNITGTVSYIAPQGDEAHNYPVEIVIPNQMQLKAGTFVTVSFAQRSKAPSLLIPRSALVESLINPYVYVVRDNKAVRRNIEAGREIGSRIEVLSGLSSGETVVVNGQINLSEGAPVRVIN